LDKGVEDALLGNPSPYSPWLTLVEDIEVGNWDEVTTFLQERELDHVASASNYAVLN